MVPVGKAAFTDYSDSCFSRWNWSGLMRNIDTSIERLNYYDDIGFCCMGICYLGRYSVLVLGCIYLTVLPDLFVV